MTRTRRADDGAREQAARESERTTALERRPDPGARATRADGGSVPVDASARPEVEGVGATPALVSLLSDPSPTVYAAVRRELERDGQGYARALDRATRSDDARTRGRARRILEGFHRRAVLRRLARHVTRSEIDLESALFLLGNLTGPTFDARPYRRALDAMAAEVRSAVAAEPDGLRATSALVQYLAGDRGYGGATEDYHHPDNIHLHRVIERRRGMPLSVCALYVLVARRAGLRAAMIPLPGHVLLRLYSADGRSYLVDPFHGGQPRSRADCVRYLRDSGLAPQPEWFQDASDAIMLQRHLLNLANSCRRRGLHADARGLRQVVRILSDSQERHRRARVGSRP